MNGNSYYITATFISCNIDSYYCVITITVYQTCLNMAVKNKYSWINQIKKKWFSPVNIMITRSPMDVDITISTEFDFKIMTWPEL